MTDYQRVNRICTDSSDASKYKGMFTQGYEDLQQANKHFQSAFGDSFAYLEPTIYQLTQQAAQSIFSAPDLSSRRDICISDSFASSMSLDMVRLNPTHPLTLYRPLAGAASVRTARLGYVQPSTL